MCHCGSTDKVSFRNLAGTAYLVGALACLPVAMMRRTTREGLRLHLIWDALEDGAKQALGVALACATAGIVNSYGLTTADYGIVSRGALQSSPFTCYTELGDKSAEVCMPINSTNRETEYKVQPNNDQRALYLCADLATDYYPSTKEAKDCARYSD